MKWKTCNKEKEKDAGGKAAHVASTSSSTTVGTSDKKQSVSFNPPGKCCAPVFLLALR